MTTAPTVVHSTDSMMPILDLHPVREAVDVLWVKATEHSTAEQVYVNKYQLAAASPFFHTLFFGESFAERANNRFQVVEPKLDALKAMFTLLDPFETETIFPCRENVKDLLALSKQYLVPAVLKKCLSYLLKVLVTCEEENLLFKLQIADEFGLQNVEDQCFADLAKLISTDSEKKAADHLKLFEFVYKSAAATNNSSCYGALSDRLKAKLLDALLWVDRYIPPAHYIPQAHRYTQPTRNRGGRDYDAPQIL